MPIPNPVYLTTYIRELYLHFHLRLRPLELEKKICGRFPQLSRVQARAAIRTAVSEGLLTYCQQYASTYLILAPFDAIPESTITLFPSASGPSGPSDRIKLQLNDGVSFGAGEHPTTRLCLAGLEFAVGKFRSRNSSPLLKSLDLGTGSGVLAIAAVLLGVQRVVAVDIDPLACHEAKANAAINRAAERIDFVVGTLECIARLDIHIVSINLRTPTLAQLLPIVLSKVPDGAMIIVSGFRPQEKVSLQAVWLLLQAQERWFSENRGWAAAVLERSKPLDSSS